MVSIRIDLATVLRCCSLILFLSSGFVFAQGQSSVGMFSVNIILNRVATAPAGSCVSQTLFNQMGAVVRVTCVDNPFVNIAPSIATQFPGTFGSTFRYPMFSSSDNFNNVTASINSFNQISGGLNSVGVASLFVEESKSVGLNAQSTLVKNATSRSFNSPTSTITDLSIYRTAPQATTDEQGLMDMVISF